MTPHDPRVRPREPGSGSEGSGQGDLLVRGAKRGSGTVDVSIRGGRIVAVGADLPGGGARELFASWTRTAAGNETQLFVSVFAGGFP